MKIHQTASLPLLLAAAAWAQPQAPRPFAHVDFVRITAGKGAEYRKALTEKVLPAHQERVKAGKEVAFVTYARRFPHGSTGDWTSVRIALANGAEAADEPQTSAMMPTAGLFQTVSGQMWRLAGSVAMDQLLRAKIVRVVYGKINPGKQGDFDRFLRETYKPQIEDGLKQGRYRGALLFRTIFPAGRDATYDLVVMYGYDDAAKAFGGNNAETITPAIRNLNEMLNGLRTMVNHELWQQTQRTE